MSYRRIQVNKDSDNSKEKYQKCIGCKDTYNCQNLIGDMCIRCHYPYKSLAEFIRANPPKSEC